MWSSKVSIGIAVAYAVVLSAFVVSGLRRLCPTLRRMLARRRRLAAHQTTVWIVLVTFVGLGVHLPFEVVSQLVGSATDVRYGFCALVVFQEQLLDTTTCLCYVVIAGQRLQTVIRNRPIPGRDSLWRLALPVLCLLHVPVLLYAPVEQRARFSPNRTTDDNGTSPFGGAVDLAMCLRRATDDASPPYHSFECEALLLVMVAFYLAIPIVVLRRTSRIHAEQRAARANDGGGASSDGQWNGIHVLSMREASRRFSLPASFKFFDLAPSHDDDDDDDDSQDDASAENDAIGATGPGSALKTRTRNQKYKKPQYRRGTLSLDMTNMALSGALTANSFTSAFSSRNNAEVKEREDEQCEESSTSINKQAECLKLVEEDEEEQAEEEEEEEEIDASEDSSPVETNELSGSDQGDESTRNRSPSTLCNIGDKDEIHATRHVSPYDVDERRVTAAEYADVEDDGTCESPYHEARGHSVCIVEERHSITTRSESFVGNTPTRLSFRHSRETTLTVEINEIQKTSTSEVYTAELEVYLRDDDKDSEAKHSGSSNHEAGKTPRSKYFETNFGMAKNSQLPALSYYKANLLPKLSFPADSVKKQSVKRKTTGGNRRRPKTTRECSLDDSERADELGSPEREQLADGHRSDVRNAEAKSRVSFEAYPDEIVVADNCSFLLNDSRSPTFERRDRRDDIPSGIDSSSRRSTPSVTERDDEDSPICPEIDLVPDEGFTDEAGDPTRSLVPDVAPPPKDPTVSRLPPPHDEAEAVAEQTPGKILRSLSVHAMPVIVSFNRPRTTSLHEITRRVFLLVAVAMVFVLPKALFLQCAPLLDLQLAAHLFVLVKVFQYSSFLAHHYVYVDLLKPLTRLLWN